ncbi:unnamed protein product [Mycetohabitans rhizoxinica HKI 454]|uniref:Uncharacterized protein n=1 Tax=Mycetohabitans rhizoxinica (strain DSM 19002 / CIP 109453 / HKI 454) TaxID=882378 RepID=E5ASJ1_MYCRK|nr:unnamed protein product [Mycetohabitans rhizoxinica HKI 454]
MMKKIHFSSFVWCIAMFPYHSVVDLAIKHWFI